MDGNTINDVVTVAGVGGTMLAGRYRVVRQLGQGGMGSVWLAEDTQLDGKPFAIKMLPTILVSNKRAYKQLKDEALVAMKLTHPNIVTLRAFEENGGNPFLVMDYVDGQTLDDYLAEKGRLSEEEAARVLRPIAAALDYAHGEGVVHRDVKPANVMIRKDGHPFILDFGIAREIQESLTRVTGKLSSGTLLYMSPEQLNGDAPKAPQDVYSFAAMAYECLKGETPFRRGAIEDQIKNKVPEPLPGGTRFDASVMAGLAKMPDDRPATCAAVLGNGDSSRVECVERVETGGRPSSAAAGGAGDVSRKAGGGKVLGILAILVALGAGVWWWMEFQKGTEGTAGTKETVVKSSFSPLRGSPPDLGGASSGKRSGAGQDSPTNIKGGAAKQLGAYGKRPSQVSGSTQPRTTNGCIRTAKTVPKDKVGISESEYRWTVTTNLVVCGDKNRPCLVIKSPDKIELRLMWCGDKTNGFWMGETEVTRKQWNRVMGKVATDVDMEGGDGDYPVTDVRYEDCCQFMGKLQKETDLAFSLPDTNSWQIACLAGSKTVYWWGDDCIEFAEGNFRTGVSDATGKSMKVKSYKSNGWGLFDMHGNVAEWCDGRYVGGGNYDSDASCCKASSFIASTDDTYKSKNTGLRVFLKEANR